MGSVVKAPAQPVVRHLRPDLIVAIITWLAGWLAMAPQSRNYNAVLLPDSIGRDQSMNSIPSASDRGEPTSECDASYACTHYTSAFAGESAERSLRLMWSPPAATTLCPGDRSHIRLP